MTEQTNIAARYTTIGMLTRTIKSGKKIWYVVKFDDKKAFTGSLVNLKRMVREHYGNDAEQEVAQAAAEINRLNDR